jgi:metallo-beta-lactamase class B
MIISTPGDVQQFSRRREKSRRGTQGACATSQRIALTFIVMGLHAQAPPPALKPETEASKALIAKASKTAGKLWPAEVHFFCEAPRANAANDPVIEPAKIFDNVYAIGRNGTIVYAIATSAGILLIDAGYAADVEPVLLDGMKKLGLDPAQIKAILVTHGHADHFGGSPYLQQHYGAKVYISEADWNFMENPPGGRGGKGKGPATVLPKHDQILVEGQAVTLGEEKVLPVAVPGHTPGAMGFLFEVKTPGKTHMAALFGGTILLPQNATPEVLKQYLSSVAHFKEEAKKHKVDVELQNHPLMDNFEARLAQLKQQPSGANPFIVGLDGYARFLDVIIGCMNAQLAR